jgi:DHA1 family bicyclomycin/chloramphenicol resistance-like MFS transporter
MNRKTSEIEFIGIIASLMALSALSVDALLPGLNDIAHDLGISNTQDYQLLVSMIFLGLGFGQLVSGPLSDSMGRKAVIGIGYLIFVFASVVCIYATSLEMMVIGRLFQGVGLSAPRRISIAIIRDRFSGSYMAKMVSFVTSIFILVPIVAPWFGKFMLDLFGWRSIFFSQLLFGFFVIIWMWKRLPETLRDENRRRMRLSLFIDGFKEFMRCKQSVLFAVILGFMTAAYMVYISACQQIYQIQYGIINEFPFIFAGLSVTYGISTFVNGKLVVRFGMLKSVSIATLTLLLISLVYILFFTGNTNPPLIIFISGIALLWFALGFIFGNTNALAMQPIGHIAGIGSAIIGFIATVVMGVPLSTFVGRYVDNTATPVFMGFAVCSLLSLLLIVYFNLVKKDNWLKSGNKLRLRAVWLIAK